MSKGNKFSIGFLNATRLLMVAFAIVAFQHIRYILFVVLIVLTIIDITKYKMRKSTLKKAILIDCIALVLIMIIAYPCYSSEERLRFNIFENSYNAVAQEAITNIKELDDTSWSEYEVNTFLPLAKHNKLIYIKHGDSIAIYFPTWNNFLEVQVIFIFLMIWLVTF